jgi:hypothetical protein
VFNQQDYWRWLKTKNVGATEIPAYGAMLVDGYDTDVAAVKVKRPTKTGMDPAVILINGPIPVGTGAEGQGTLGDPALALVSGSPAVGDGLGTVADQYYLGATAGTGFTAWSANSGGTALVMRGYRGVVGVVCGTGASAGSMIQTTLSTN